VRWSLPRYNNDKIRVAYISADFQNHATSHLMAGLFEAHTRDRFEFTAMSFGKDDGTPVRGRLRAAFDRFIDAGSMTEADMVRQLRDLKIDIAVDLKGFTNDARAKIFRDRVAPVQVNFLGYPCTWGSDCMDYIIADERLIPRASEKHYSEKIVWMPESYQPNDRKRQIADFAPARTKLGLPATGFVFCCFNGSYKITPKVYDVWMRLLLRVGGSVLWLLDSGEIQKRNLRREAAARGVDPDRIIFAPPLETPIHLARQRAADLFLDTTPVNAHTTASDALWAGLPLLTLHGSTFAGRVAASLLHADGLPELIATTPAEYEAIAYRLATSPDEMSAIRAKVARNRDTCALFDTDRFRKHLEAAFVTMHERHQRGEPPVSFTVPAA
jgi:protein O-GlcNAc transferase